MDIKRMKRAGSVFLIMLLAGVAGDASAGIVNVNAQTAGYYQSFYSSTPETGIFLSQFNPFNIAWITGHAPAGTSFVDYRTYVSFDLSAIGGTITDATLEMDVALQNNALSRGFFSDGINETVEVRQYGEAPGSGATRAVANNLADLSTSGGTPLHEWEDLGDGAIWDSKVIDATVADTTMLFDLTAALGEMNAARVAGVNWAAGLFISTISSPTSLFIEGLSGNQFGTATTNVLAPKLILTTAMSPVPIPSAVWLFGSGVVGLVGIARRRRENCITLFRKD